MKTQLTCFNHQWYPVITDENNHTYFLGAWTMKKDAQAILDSYLEMLTARGVK